MGKKPKYGQQVTHRQTGKTGKVTGINRGTIRVTSKNGDYISHTSGWTPSRGGICSLIILTTITIPASQ